MQVAKGSVDSPVSLSTQKTLRKRAIKAYRQDAREDPKKGVSSQQTSEASLVGFAVGFDNHGVPRYVTATTSDPNEVEAQQAQLQNRVSDLQQMIQNNPTVGTQEVTAADSPIWTLEFGICAGGGADSDAGSITHDVSVYHLDNDSVDNGEVFAAVQVLEMVPDVYDNLDGTCIQDWQPAINSPGTQSESLTNYAPQNPVSGDGSKSASFSARGVSKSFSWTHNGDVTTEDKISSQDADELYAEFDQLFGGGTGDNTEELGCASLVETNQPSDGKYNIVTLDAKGLFFHSTGQVYDETEITDQQTIEVDYNHV
ncbi:hypothetical protein ELS19_11850 [Halogeometricum borinquense]|uniref:Uncharacterized protein n=1 Tax=Halogeometricum borinquense TaxID=60847 RepID=A0A482T9I5_9EURY|nr:hypothetical protein [Halogeometricum borinquense]RYJ14574.1 hypothetical protein ELS19_11850 [Halogeometricum borinquense]